MIFIQEHSNKVTAYEIKSYARRALLRFPKKTAEVLLDKYLRINYKLTLVQACLLIINNLKVSQSSSFETTLYTQNLTYDKLAQLITFGNECTPGSKILQLILNYRKEN